MCRHMSGMAGVGVLGIQEGTVRCHQTRSRPMEMPPSRRAQHTSARVVKRKVLLNLVIIVDDVVGVVEEDADSDGRLGTWAETAGDGGSTRATSLTVTEDLSRISR